MFWGPPKRGGPMPMASMALRTIQHWSCIIQGNLVSPDYSSLSYYIQQLTQLRRNFAIFIFCVTHNADDFKGQIPPSDDQQINQKNNWTKQEHFQNGLLISLLNEFISGLITLRVMKSTKLGNRRDCERTENISSFIMHT